MSYRSMGIDGQAQRAQNFADASGNTDLTTLQQVNNAIANALAGLSWKQSVRAATTANGTLASAYANGSIVDGVTLVTGDRILLKNQTTGAENGIYTVNASGAPTRGTDADSAGELLAATVYVREGTANKDQAFTQTVDSITLGTTALAWAQVGGGTAYTAGNGLSLTGSQFAVVPGTGIIADGTSTRIDPASVYARRSYAADIPTTTAGSTVVMTHGLGSLDVIWQVYRKSDGVLIDIPDTARDTTSVTLQPPIALGANAYRFLATLAS